MSQISHRQFVPEGASDDIENRLSEVVVYSDQAYVKRKASVPAKEGTNLIFVELQAFYVDADSAQAIVYGEGELLSVQYREIPQKDMPQKDLKTLDDRREELDLRQKTLEFEKDTLKKQIQFLDSVIGFAEYELPKKMKTSFPSIENVGSMCDFLGERYRQLNKTSLDLDRRIAELKKEIRLIEQQLKQSRRPKNAVRKVIEILFNAKHAQRVSMDVFYVVHAALWEPVYKVDVSLDLSQVQLTMFARIQQKTGEPWHNVKLSVSNAAPLKSGALPDMQSWYLNYQTVAPAMLRKAGSAPMMDILSDFEDPEAEMAGAAAEPLEVLQPVAEFQQAAQKELPTAFEYEIPLAVYLDSGDGDTMLSLYTKDISGKFYALAVPRNDPLSYLVCESTPDRALLPGRMNIHFGGRFVGTTLLSHRKPGEELLVNLGVEQGITAIRETVTDKLTETFFGKVDRTSVVRALEYRIAVENTKDTPQAVRIIDSVPVSKTDRIQVKDIEMTPAPTHTDYLKREGVMRWDFQIAPGESRDIHIKCFVKHPKDKPPGGL